LAALVEVPVVRSITTDTLVERTEVPELLTIVAAVAVMSILVEGVLLSFVTLRPIADPLIGPAAAPVAPVAPVGPVAPTDDGAPERLTYHEA
jgi:hypothetical protein